ncbi:MAG: MucB/RseB C-terminal domain-containing protein, partial [Pseudomonadota bacterium]
PDKQSVLVEAWNGQGTLFSPIQDKFDAIAAAYDFQLTGQERVAGRDAIIVSIKPKDEMRFARRLWLDEQTGFPLKSERLDVNGALVERIRFADIELDAELRDDDFASRYPLDKFKWYPAVEPTTTGDEAVWYSASLPPGYRMESGHVERLDRGGAVVTHIVYTDGLSRVSVFIKSASGSAATTRNRLGNANAFSVARGDYRITAVGEVPPAAVEQIALSMQR